MSVFYDVLMEKSAQRQEREEDKDLFGPILPAGATAGGLYLGHMLDQRRAQREYDARVSARAEKTQSLPSAIAKIMDEIGEVSSLAEGGDTDEVRARAQKRLGSLRAQQARLTQEFVSNTIDRLKDGPQSLYRGKLLGATVGGGLGYGAKRLFDRHNAKKRGEQR